ncbi:MAG: hypothetical protein ABSF95_10735 [Verrucomicrobiota bacterium]|jgi:hypothetical protein
MKKSTLAIVVLGVVVVAFLAGCVVRRVYVPGPPVAAGPPAAEVVVGQAPPAPPAEVYVPAPGPGYLWAPGFWSWEGRWVWKSGSWVIRPHPQAVWVPGHWGRHGRGYVWIGGYWR